MVVVAKWLTHRIVAPAFEGSIPSIHPSLLPTEISPTKISPGQDSQVVLEFALRQSQSVLINDESSYKKEIKEEEKIDSVKAFF